jgi:uncharacterized membrane protein YkvA (DUF1232 family)
MTEEGFLLRYRDDQIVEVRYWVLLRACRGERLEENSGMEKMALLRKFTKRASLQDIPKIAGKLGAMNRGPVVKIWDKVQVLWKFIKDPNVVWAKKAAAVGSLVYLVSPLDAVPDFIPAGGLLDDVAVILFVVQMLAESLKVYTADSASESAAMEAEAEVDTGRNPDVEGRGS